MRDKDPFPSIILAQVSYRTTLALVSQIQCITYRFDTGSYFTAHSTSTVPQKTIPSRRKERILITPIQFTPDFYII